ncbi:hypothetical protein HK104_004979, partial [Borealophlyctis nickersoniae]
MLSLVSNNAHPGGLPGGSHHHHHNNNQQQQIRPLVIKQNGVEVSIPVPLTLWHVAENIKDLFPTQVATDDGEEITEMEVVSNLLQFSLDHAGEGPNAAARPATTTATTATGHATTTATATTTTKLDILPFISTVFQFFHTRYLRTNTIHA